MKSFMALALLLAVTPFWEAKDCAQWSEEELELFLSDSPWARPAEAVALRGARGTASRSFLATAAPVRLAETEWRRRRIQKALREADDSWQEWEEFLAKDSSRFIVLAIALPPAAAQDAREMAEMENQSLLRVGKKKFKMSGYFPSGASDPFTRLIFPRVSLDSVKELVFEIYVPGDGGSNFREAVYLTKELNWRGKPAY
jgi:hypothetical protein